MSRYYVRLLSVLILMALTQSLMASVQSTSVTINNGSNPSATLTLLNWSPPPFNTFRYAVHSQSIGEGNSGPIWGAFSNIPLNNSTITVVGSGLHLIRIIITGSYTAVEWEQWIYVPFKISQNVIKDEVALAKKYLPVLLFHDLEEYFPVALDDPSNPSNSILDFISPDQKNPFSLLRFETSSGTIVVTTGQELKDFLQYNGHAKWRINPDNTEVSCVISTGPNNCTPHFLRNQKGTISSPTLYYDLSEENNKIYLTYYFFYAFDPKGGGYDAPDPGAHVFDRESFTLVFDRFDQSGIPCDLMDETHCPPEIVYGHHVTKQKISFKGCENDTVFSLDPLCSDEGRLNTVVTKLGDTIDWKKGRLKLSWIDAPKSDAHPVIHIAKGSHAIYPIYGYYNGFFPSLGVFRVLQEKAGNSTGNALTYPYQINLRKLDFQAQKYLAFSGRWIETRIGSPKQFLGKNFYGRLPPYIARVPYEYWVNNAEKPFDICLDNTVNSTVFATNDCDIVRQYFAAPTPAIPPPPTLNDTGITTCSDASSNGLPCPVAGFPGQDAQFGRDVTHNDDSDGHAGFSFTKLDANGNDLPASESQWSCVRDNVTGLIWENKTDDGGIHDKDNTYRWGGVTALGSGSIGTYYADWDELVNGSNAESLCGYTDWHVPTRMELASLVDYSIFNMAVDSAYFPWTASNVWSSSPFAGHTARAWIVYFYDGRTSLNFRNNALQVRLVRSGQ